MSRPSRDLVRRGLDSLLAHEERSIEFPEDYSLGTVYVGDEDALLALAARSQSATQVPVDVLDASGTIRIQGGKRALLKIGPGGPDLRPLGSFSSDALWGVMRGRETEGLTDTELAYIARLTGLRHLSLYVPEITDYGVASLRSLRNLKSLRLTGAYLLTDAGLEFISALTELEALGLYGVFIGDTGVAHLSSLTKLVWLSLKNPVLSDHGLTLLARLISLESLDFNFTSGWAEFTDEGLRHLPVLANLRLLGLWQTNTRDRGLAHLSGMTGLEGLGLGWTMITDRGIEHLVDLVNVKELALFHTEITDSGLAILSRLSGLERLNLDETQITDAGLVHLERLTKLRSLSLRSTGVTESGLDQLRGLPSLRWPVPIGDA